MSTNSPASAYVSPARSGMPALSNLDRTLRANMLLTQAFRGNALPFDYSSRVMVATFVRLTARAVDEYEVSREKLEEFASKRSNGQIFPLLQASDHLEVCISLLDRICTFLERMQDQPELTSFIPQLHVMKKENKRRVAILRNASEHLETRLLQRKICEGDYVMLNIGEDSCELERCEVAYADLAMWLKELHALASCFASSGIA